MGNVVVDLSMSLDGFIAGSDDSPELPLGRGGERLFTWMSAGPESNRVERRLAPPDSSKVVMDEWMTEYGAIVSGRRTFDIAGGWKDEHPLDVPIFVVTHQVPTHGEWSPRVSFVTDGIERALGLAQEAAGDLKGVGVRCRHRPATASCRDARRDPGQRRPAPPRVRCAALRSPRPELDHAGTGQGHRVRRRHPSSLPRRTRMTTLEPRARRRCRRQDACARTRARRSPPRTSGRALRAPGR